MNFANATKQRIKALEPTIVYHPENFYIALMDIGTTSYSTLLLVDTGSDPTWVRGEGCINCFPLSVGNFKYAESRINSLVSCDDPHCFLRICQDNFVFLKTTIMIKVTLVVIFHLTHSLSLRMGGGQIGDMKATKM